MTLDPTPFDILLIDDNNADAEITSRMLARRGWRCRSTDEGRARSACAAECRWHCQRAPSPFAPKTHFDGVRFTTISSVELVKRFKADPATAHIPVVVLTVATNTVVVGDHRALGVREFLFKPIQLDAFRALALPLGIRFDTG